MATTTHNARLMEPVPYFTAAGKQSHIPAGPCLLERIDERRVDIIWGPTGQSSAVLAVDTVKAAADAGHLLLLD